MIACRTCLLRSLPVLIAWWNLELLCLKTQFLSFSLFFLFFWILFRNGICIYLRGSLASKQFCSQWFHIFPQHHTGRLLADMQHCWFISLLGISVSGIMLDSKHYTRILGKKKKNDPSRWALAPHSDHCFSSHSPWLPAICRSRYLPTSTLPPASRVPLQFFLISLASVASHFIFTGHLD